MHITAVLPVSRTKYLDRVLESLANQTRKPDSLLVVFDGEDKDFIEVRNKIVEQPYNYVLCVKSTNRSTAYAIQQRRIHIANIHNQAGDLLEETDWIFSIEDDGILPPHALEQLVKSLKNKDLFEIGMVTGVELGRWGVPYVGAWTVDNVLNPKIVTSMENRTPESIVEPIDACGLYCALIRADEYKEHMFFTRNGLGPDVNLGLHLRNRGYMNYIDWSIPVTHLTSNQGIEIEIRATDKSHKVTLKLLSGSTWKASR